MPAAPAGHAPCCDASFVLDSGHVARPLTARCDSSASDEVTCGSRLREDHQLLSARSVTSCQLGRVSCQCQPGGDSKCWPGEERAELLQNSPYLHCKDREWGDFGRQLRPPGPPTKKQMHLREWEHRARQNSCWFTADFQVTLNAGASVIRKCDLD